MAERQESSVRAAEVEILKSAAVACGTFQKVTAAGGSSSRQTVRMPMDTPSCSPRSASRSAQPGGL